MRANQERIHDLAEAVFDRRPVLRDILLKQGGTPALTYARSLADNPTNVPEVLKAEFIDSVAHAAERLLGKESGLRVVRHLERYYSISTADHHGPLSHPFFVHADLLAAAAHVGESKYETQIVLATSNISLGNSSLPRSVLYHGETGEEPERVNLFPASKRAAPVFSSPPYAAIQGLSRLPGRVRALIEDIYLSPGALGQERFSDQVTVTNARLWERFFPAASVTLPPLTYLALEDIVTDLLIRHHLFNETPIHAFLFSPSVLDAVEEKFDGIAGAFNRAEGAGTFLFWLLPEGATQRVSLSRVGDELVSHDGTHRVPLTPTAIEQGLREQRLIPSTMLSLTLLSAYYGVKCLGGFSQTTYLRCMEDAYAEIFGDGLQPPTNGFCSDLVIGLLARPAVALAAATGADFALHSDEGSWQRFCDAANTLTLGDAVTILMPDLYRILYTEPERSTRLTEITRTDVLKTIGENVPVVLRYTPL